MYSPEPSARLGLITVLAALAMIALMFYAASDPGNCIPVPAEASK